MRNAVFWAVLCVAGASHWETRRLDKKLVAVPDPKPWEERWILTNNGNRSGLVDPVSWQNGSLINLNAARYRGISEFADLSASIPCTKREQCDSLRLGVKGPHFELSRRLGLKNAVFLRFANCNSPKNCDDVGSLGNNIGFYWIARAAAKAAQVNFVYLRDLKACPDSIIAWLPAVWAPPTKEEDPNVAYKKAEKMTCGGRDNFIHLSDKWVSATPEARDEIHSALHAWRQASKADHAPLDDVAVHFRCGNVLAQKHGQYGLVPFQAVAALVPPDSNVSVGIVTQPYPDLCRGFHLQQSQSLHGASQCACQCDYLLDELVTTLRSLRPRATVTVHSNDNLIAAWWRLALAPVATLCQSSTFCLWPTLAARRGFITDGSLFPQAHKLASLLPGLTVITKPPLVTYHDLGKDKLRNGCGTSIKDLRSKVARLLKKPITSFSFNPLSS